MREAFLAVQKEFGSFDAYVWRFVNGKPLRRKRGAPVPVTTAKSEALSRDLLNRGFKFVGPTICYSFMQAVGMVNDHDANCFRYREIARPGQFKPTYMSQKARPLARLRIL